MPLLKYYCDYCEKQFQDTPAARKRHLQGVQHQRAKALYYQNSSSSSSFLPGGTIRDSMGISLGNLPPSLKPPPEGGYPPLPFIDWYEIRVAVEKGAHMFFVPTSK
ncbi:hypothetical protein RHGRI_014346 [Rhododendron griersonianum]|uniref:U1-type domain-containing protein n=1 Tax=Rhododendron griersonianum TaxID=479676 RepID=A0AAV6K9D7_9ERIC|nr:hypothetical protein RHGRI_014346 [Rhododendron griersonianum]